MSSIPGAIAMRGRRVGLLGGSFNPAHEGHRHISLAALRSLGLDQVWWLISPQNPLKPRDNMAALEARATRARAVAKHRQIRVTTLEAQLGTTYTAKTLGALRTRLPATHFVWLMGADNLAQLPQWQQWTQIPTQMPIAVFARQPYDFKALAGAAAHRMAAHRLPAKAARTLLTQSPPAWVFLPIIRHPASATRIRAEGGWPQPAATGNSSDE
ncbi:MAG: nicotinate-nucleotide adenylyltransferase [Alphaproteobacteria bacterium]